MDFGKSHPLLTQADLLQNLLPFEISKYVVANLDSRLPTAASSKGYLRLSDHRPLQLFRNVFQTQPSKSVYFSSYSSSCRLGESTLVVGQVAVRENLKLQPSASGTSGVNVELKVQLPKDPRGQMRRQTHEEKELQVSGLLSSKLTQCISQSLSQEEGVPPIELVFALHVIQDTLADGNLLCALSATLADLLQQVHSQYRAPGVSGSSLVSKLFWTTVALKCDKKVIVDPQSQQEASISNNLIATTSFLPLSGQNEVSSDQISVSIDKGSSIIRAGFGGQAAVSSSVQLEFESQVVSLKELRDISEYVRTSVAPKVFGKLVKQSGNEPLVIEF